MENVALNNGIIVAMESNEDIVDIVGEHCSYELAHIISNRLVDFDAQKLLVEAKAHTDEESYLASLESCECALRDVLELAEKLSEYISKSKRISKEKIYQDIINITQRIEQEI